jgi:hypothetical protein
VKVQLLPHEGRLVRGLSSLCQVPIRIGGSDETSDGNRGAYFKTPRLPRTTSP